MAEVARRDLVERVDDGGGEEAEHAGRERDDARPDHDEGAEEADEDADDAADARLLAERRHRQGRHEDRAREDDRRGGREVGRAKAQIEEHGHDREQRRVGPRGGWR